MLSWGPDEKLWMRVDINIECNEVAKKIRDVLNLAGELEKQVDELQRMLRNTKAEPVEESL